MQAFKIDPALRWRHGPTQCQPMQIAAGAEMAANPGQHHGANQGSASAWARAWGNAA